MFGSPCQNFSNTFLKLGLRLTTIRAIGMYDIVTWKMACSCHHRLATFELSVNTNVFITLFLYRRSSFFKDVLVDRSEALKASIWGVDYGTHIFLGDVVAFELDDHLTFDSEAVCFLIELINRLLFEFCILRFSLLFPHGFAFFFHHGFGLFRLQICHLMIIVKLSTLLVFIK